MQVRDAQIEMRTVYAGGFWGQLLFSIVWLASAALGAWVTPKMSIITVAVGGFFVFPLVKLLLRLQGRRSAVSNENPFNNLAIEAAFVLPFSMLLLVPVALYRLNWFFPALMILVGAHYLPFASLYGMRMFLFLAGIMMGSGVVVALFFSGTFSLGAWIAGIALFVFAWIGRLISAREVNMLMDTTVK